MERNKYVRIRVQFNEVEKNQKIIIARQDRFKKKKLNICNNQYPEEVK